jgi:hypothetical protein
MTTAMNLAAHEISNSIRQAGQYHPIKRRESIMWPTPYTGLKIVHDQQIKKALERYHFSRGQARQKRGLIQIFAAFVARFTSFSARKSKSTSLTQSL